MKNKLLISLFFFLVLYPRVVYSACPPGLLPCSEDYPQSCGNGGTQLCHKIGCNTDGQPGPNCPWEVGSSCGICENNGPTSTPVPGLPLCYADFGAEYGECNRDPHVGQGGGDCNVKCKTEWSWVNRQTEPDFFDCKAVHCSCDNGVVYCCRPYPSPSPTTVPPQPPGGPTNTPAPTATPVPTSTPTLTPTSTPRPSATPTPTPNKQFVPVTVPTTAPRQSGAAGSASSMTWRCLKAEKTARSNYGETKLTGEGFPTEVDIYIVGCVQGATTFYCTTGKENLDNLLRISKGTSGYVFIPKNGNPIKLTSENLSTLVESRTPTVMTHVFYGVYAGDFNKYPGEASSIQYGRFDFEQDYKKCVAIRWDPYGRVFDSQSLEPMPGINVFISDKNRKNINLPGIINPVTTNPAGFFNFYIEPGEYYLEPESVEGYTFSASPNLNPNYNKIYSNLYKPDEPIYEVVGTVQHRDITLDPGINQPLKNSPSEISFNILPGYDTTKTRIIGEVSHPLTRVELYQDKTKIGETVADKFGYYEISIDTSKIKQEIPIIPKLTKVEVYNQPANSPMINSKNIFTRLLYYLAKIFKPRSTKADPPRSVTGSSLMPIPHYLEGFVYDTNKQITANATVDIMVKMSDQSYYQTTTDDLGKVVIMPNNLPIFEYYLKVAPSNGSFFTITTEEFINNNRDYLEANQINLINATKNNLPVVQ